MRKSFNGLAAIAGQLAARGLESGALFAFTNKRLETGAFSWPAPSSAGASSLSLAPEALQLLLNGIDLRGAEMRPWYERQEKSPEI